MSSKQENNSLSELVFRKTSLSVLLNDRIGKKKDELKSGRASRMLLQ